MCHATHTLPPLLSAFVFLFFHHHHQHSTQRGALPPLSQIPLPPPPTTSASRNFHLHVCVCVCHRILSLVCIMIPFLPSSIVCLCVFFAQSGLFCLSPPHFSSIFSHLTKVHPNFWGKTTHCPSPTLSTACLFACLFDRSSLAVGLPQAGGFPGTGTTNAT